MSAVEMTERRAAEVSPRIKARTAAVFYLLEGAPAVFQQVVIARFVISGDAIATANNILANEMLFRLWFAAALLAVACHIVYTVLFYDLFKSVNRSIALLAASVSLVACALQAFATLFQFAPLARLGRRELLGSVDSGTGADPCAPVPQPACAGLQHLPDLLRPLVDPDWLSHLPVDLLPARHRRAVGA